MKYLIILISLILSLLAIDVKPFKEIKVDGAVKDMVIRDNLLIAGTDTGKMQIYDIKEDKIIKTIQLPKIKDFMGDIIDTRVSSVDKIDGKYLLLSDSGKGGYFNLWIYENEKLNKIITPEDKKSLVKARFIDKNHVLLGYLSNEISLYDLNSKKELYKTAVSESKFSDFALNEDRSKVAVTCESGIIYILDTKTGKILKELKSEHVDNVYKLDFKNGKISGAGQDRRASLYDAKSGKGEHLEGSFLIYATGLSPSAQKVAYAMDEQNNIYIYNTLTKSLIAKLKGQKSTLNSIVFKDENTIFSASDDDTIMMWRLNQ
jgi:WD40 repeat protein